MSIQIIESLWPRLSNTKRAYTTPDNIAGSDFTVAKSDGVSITIQTSGGFLIAISRKSFIAAVHFLLEGCHVSLEKACRIGANIGEPGSLDMVTRIHSGGTMVISYILPILATTGVVEVRGDRPNKAWICP